MNDLVKREGLYYQKFTDVPFTGEIDEGWERGNFKKGRKEGKWVSYFENGQLFYKGDLKNGMKEGKWVFYFTNGQLARKGEYKNGVEEGMWVFYQSNGQVLHKGNFKNGWEEGTWVYFNFDGSEDTSRSGVYRDGEKVSD